MTSRAQRRLQRKRRNQITLAGGETVDSASIVTRGRRADLTSEGPPVALMARARMAGCDLDAAKSPLAGCAVGRSLMAEKLHKDERADLWQAVCHIRRVWVAYDRAIGAPSRHAQCLRILAPVDAMTTEGATFDDRPEEDRHRAAVGAYMAVQGWLGHVDNAARSAAIIAVVDDAGLPNWPGIMRALRCVSEGIKGQRITPRLVAGA